MRLRRVHPLEENRRIKKGEVPGDRSDAKREQKDVDARFTKKNGKSYFGYKNHIDVDAEHKLIRTLEVTPANVHDSQVLDDLIDPDNARITRPHWRWSESGITCRC